MENPHPDSVSNSPRRSTLQFDNALGQTVAPIVGDANHDGTAVIHRPFFARARSTIPPTVPWYQSLHGLPEVGGAHKTRPLLPEVHPIHAVCIILTRSDFDLALPRKTGMILFLILIPGVSGRQRRINLICRRIRSQLPERCDKRRPYLAQRA